MSRSSSFLLLSIFVCYVASTSLPDTFRLTSNTTHRSTAQATCTGFQVFQLRPLYRDCNRAIDPLSSSRLPGYFHVSGLTDEWQLPVTKKVGTCKVSLRITPFVIMEASSWEDLKTAARRLNEECRVKAALGDVTGGEVTAGQHDWIQIWIGRRGGGVDEVADG